MEILKHKISEDSYSMIVKEISCEDGMEIELAKEFLAKEFGTSVDSLGSLTIQSARFKSVRKFILM